MQTTQPDTALVMAIRNEIAASIAGIIDRDHFLQRLTLRVADLGALPHLAVYIGSHHGDLTLRVAGRVPASSLPARLPLTVLTDGNPTAHAAGMTLHVAPLMTSGDPFGVLVVYRPEVEDAPLVGLRQTLDSIAYELSPAVAIAERYHAVNQASVVDLPTGAYAPWYFNQRVDEEIARATRTGNAFTVVLVGVDQFDEIQRRLGYSRADQLLRDLAGEFTGLTRVCDVVGIRSRTQFSVLLPDTDLHGADTVIARVHQRAERVLERNGWRAALQHIIIATGASSFPSDGDRPTSLFVAAEHRLAEAFAHQRRAHIAS